MKKILLVEEDPNLQQIYNNKLTTEGFSVLVAPSASEALTYLLQDKIDLVLLDVMLPGEMNGLELLEKIRSIGKIQKTPVIILTNLMEEKDTALNSGASDYIIKAEMTPAEVVEKVRQHL